MIFEESDTMRIGSLFSGAGMLDVAALELFPAAQIAWHCENDPAPAKVLAHHWPGVPNLGDVTTVDWSSVDRVDVLTGGFPCQDVSAAGRRAGMRNGNRSGLWAHMRTAIAELQPRIVLIENVRGLLSAKAARDLELEDGDLGSQNSPKKPELRALGAVLGDLADLGYDAEWICLRASEVGACHRRERVFILAHPADADRHSVWKQSERRPGGSGAAFARWDREADGPVTLLPTPQVADVTGGHRTRSGARSNELLLPGVAEAYSSGTLLPTPRATDGTKGGPNQRGSSGDLMLPSAVARLLPTPRASDGSGGPNPLERAERMDDVETRVIRLGNQWGDYAPAIARQELLSSSAPLPTEPNSRGNQRLSARFAEWMMFWPNGWVTDPDLGLSRNQTLKIIGNGVVPAQAVAAFRELAMLAEDFEPHYEGQGI